MSISTTASRFHDFSYGHRVYRHEGMCAHLHGHNGRVHFTLEAELDSVGRVLDFSVMKNMLCMWVEDNWDHRFLVWELDPWAASLQAIDGTVVLVPFNPTAENMARYLLDTLAPKLPVGVHLTKVVVEETRKCRAAVEKT